MTGCAIEFSAPLFVDHLCRGLISTLCRAWLLASALKAKLAPHTQGFDSAGFFLKEREGNVARCTEWNASIYGRAEAARQADGQFVARHLLYRGRPCRKRIDMVFAPSESMHANMSLSVTLVDMCEHQLCLTSNAPGTKKSRHARKRRTWRQPEPFSESQNARCNACLPCLCA